jgi:hypothetical protein
MANSQSERDKCCNSRAVCVHDSPALVNVGREEAWVAILVQPKRAHLHIAFCMEQTVHK